MTNLTKIDFYCLRIISDDYENLKLIEEVLKRENVDVSENQVFSSLCHLVSEKFASAYEYDALKGSYIRIAPPKDISLRDWFYITKRGIDCLHENRKAHPEWANE